MAAHARLARYKTSQTTNPEYQMSDLGDSFSMGESAAYIVIVGDKVSRTVNRSWVEFLFGKDNPLSSHPPSHTPCPHRPISSHVSAHRRCNALRAYLDE